MSLLYIILIALLFGWSLTTSEFTRSLSGLVATRYLHSYGFLLCFVACIAVGGIIAEPISHPMEKELRLTSPAASLIVAAAAAFSVFTVAKFSTYSTVIYSTVGAFVAWKLFAGQTDIIPFACRHFLSWMTAPVMTGLLAYIITTIYRKYIADSNIHFFRLSYYLKVGILVNTLIFAVLFGANNGLLILILNSTVRTDFSLFMAQISFNTDSFLFLISVLSVFLATYYVAIRKVSLHAQEISHIGTETILLSFIAVNAVLFLYTVISIPLSVLQIVSAALMGSSLSRKNSETSLHSLKGQVTAMVLNPLVAFATAYLLLNSVRINTLPTPQHVIMTPSRINITTPVILSVIICILIVLLFYILRENKLKLKAQKEALRHQESLFQNQKSLSAMEVRTVLLENESLNTKLEQKRQELTNIALNISEQKVFLEHTYRALKDIRDASSLYDKNRKTEELEKFVLQKMNFSHEIETFYSEVEHLHKDFNIRLSEQHPNLTENDRRLVTLLRLGFSTKHISSLNNISPKSVEIARYRLRNKLGIPHDQKLSHYLQSI